MNNIKFIPKELKYLLIGNTEQDKILHIVHCYKLVYTPLTKLYFINRSTPMGSNPDAQGEALPGLSLAEWLEASEMSYSAFSRLVPCAVAYPRKIALGLARPSYELACRIEQVTDGMVPRTRWYPAPPVKNTQYSIEEDI
jgi:hypothetical protein